MEKSETPREDTEHFMEVLQHALETNNQGISSLWCFRTLCFWDGAKMPYGFEVITSPN